MKPATLKAAAAFALGMFGLCPYAYAEKIEMVTYYASSSGEFQRVNANRGAVGPTFRSIPDADPLDGSGPGLKSGNMIVEGRVGIGTTDPTEQIEITGNLRLPPTTATTGIIKSGPLDTFIHRFGIGNFFAGLKAGNLTMTGVQNTGVGEAALKSNTTGNHNTAIGTTALFSNTSGGQNTAVGVGSLGLNTIGTTNVAVGFAALSQNLSGGGNIAVGSGSLAGNITGSYNVAVGGDALLNSTTPSGNVALGDGALKDNTAGGGNTAVGYKAGSSDYVYAKSNITGSGNTFIGNGASPGVTTPLTNATAIGLNALVLASNSLVLGGTLGYAVNVGIGTGAPQTQLDVNGAISVRGNRTASPPPPAVSPLDEGRIYFNPFLAHFMASESGANYKRVTLNGIGLITGTYTGDGTGGSERRSITVPGIAASRPIRLLMVIEPADDDASLHIKTETMPASFHYVNGNDAHYRSGGAEIRFETDGFSFKRSNDRMNRAGDVFHYVILIDS